MKLLILLNISLLTTICLIECRDFVQKEARVADHRTFMKKVLKKPFLRPTLFDTVVVVAKEDVDDNDDDLFTKSSTKILHRVTAHSESTTSTTKIPSTKNEPSTMEPDRVITKRTESVNPDSDVPGVESRKDQSEQEELNNYRNNLDKYAFKVLNESMKIAVEQSKDYYCGINVKGQYYFRPNDDYHVVDLHNYLLTEMIRDACNEKRRFIQQRMRDRNNIPHQLLNNYWDIDGDIFRDGILRHVTDTYNLGSDEEECPPPNSVNEKKLVKDVKMRLDQLVGLKEFRDGFKVESFRMDPWPGVTFSKETIRSKIDSSCKLLKIPKKYPRLAVALGYLAFLWFFIL